MRINEFSVPKVIHLKKNTNMLTRKLKQSMNTKAQYSQRMMGENTDHDY